jgi:hypothetical protein
MHPLHYLRRFHLPAGASVAAALALLCALAVPRAQACAIPVFRYALEHWPAMPCRISVFHRGALNAGQQQVVEALGQSNLCYVEACDLAAPTNSPAAPQADQSEIWDKIRNKPEVPAVVLSSWGGREFVPEAVWAQPLSRATSDLLARGLPMHREIARRLLAGDSAVWVLLTCGDAKRDAAARKMLTATLKEMEEAIKLPHELDPNDSSYEEAMNTNIALRVRFTLLEVPGQSVEATMMRQALRSITTNAVTTTDPVAIPVFGRGLALDAVSGAVLEPEVVQSACMFLCSACSCSVKEMRLGVSLFIPFDWDAVVTRGEPAGEALPPLTVPGAAAASAGGGAKSQPQAAASGDGFGFSRGVWSVMGVVVLVVVIGTLWLLGGKKGDE